jgi:hypothetical protein
MGAPESGGTRQLVGQGKTQLLCETYINIKPPMSQIIRETYNVAVADYTVFADQVVVKGTVEKTIYYLHPHGKKASNDQEEDDASKDSKDENGKDDDKSGEGKEKEESQDQSAPPDEFKCLNSWGQLLDSYGGIVHFNQQIFEFMGTVAIAAVVPGDTCTVDLAEVKDYETFVPTTIENTGLISGGTQVFKIDIAVTATR